MSKTMADHVRHLQERLEKAERERDEARAALRSLQGYGLEFEDTKTVTIALEPWHEAMKALE